MLCCDQELTLVSYFGKSSKMALLLSTCHEDNSITYPTQKPEFIEYYNNTKGGVEEFYRLYCSIQPLRKPTRGPCACFMD